jgi:hypothetical protein
MNTQSKKLEMADKMYNQNSKGGKGVSPKDYQNGKETKPNARGEKFDMNGKGTGFNKGEKYEQANVKGSFKGGYEQADKSGSMKGGYKQANT